MKAILAELYKHPVSTPLLLNGTIIVGRDIAHAKFKELIDAGKRYRSICSSIPSTTRVRPRPRKGRRRLFRPTTAGRMDSYVDLLQRKAPA